MNTHILYIPGLGDGYDSFRSRALSFWNRRNVHASLVPSIWYDGGNMDQKLERISRAIDKVPAGERIVLIGESAGATLALQTATRDKRVSKVITLCGVARPNTPIAGYLRRRAPALDEAVNTLPETFDTSIECIRAFNDSVVGKRYSVIRDAKEHVVWSVGHFITISLCLTILSFIPIGIAKKA